MANREINEEGIQSSLGGGDDGCVELQSSLLLVVGEPLNVEQKDLVLERIVTELSSWDVEASKCDINQELNNIEPFKSNNQEGEKIFEHKSQKVNVTILVNPTLRTTTDRVTSFLSKPSNYRSLLHSGPTLTNSGSWLLQDGPLSCHDLCEAIRKANVPESSSDVLLDVSLVSDFLDYNEATLQKACSKVKVRLSRPSKVLTDESGLIKFSDNLSTYLKGSIVSDRLKSSDVQGSMTFDRPTCYVFPAGQGSSLLFGINGFTFLVDGGYGRNCCFWDFVRHLTKLDGILISRLSQDNIFGFSSFFEKKGLDKSGPEVGVVFLNIGDARHKHPLNESPSRATSGLLVSIAEEGRLLADNLSVINLAPPLPCAASQNHISLYYKVGHGSLDMFVLNPVQDTKELKDFLSSWSRAVDSYKGGVPVSDSVSVACLLVWKPSSHLKENVVRILCPGRMSQQKLFDSFDRFKTLACFQTKAGNEKVAVKKAQVSASTNRGIVTPASARLSTKPVAATKQEVKKTSSSTSLEHKTNDTRKLAEVKRNVVAVPKEPLKKPADHGRASKACTSPLKSPTKTPRPASVKEVKPIKGGADRKIENKLAPGAAETKDKVPESAKIESEISESRLSAKESKEEAKETEEVSSTAVTPSSGEESKPEVAADGKEAQGNGLFEPEKEWGNPEGLPSPMKNPDEPSADQSVKKAGGDGQKNLDKTKKMNATGDRTSHLPTKRPPTCTDRMNAAIKEDPSKVLTSVMKKSKGAGEGLTIKSANTNKPEFKKPLKPVHGFYVDLSYVPSQVDVEFFRRVRAQHYIISSSNPDSNILNSLLDAKATWEEADQWEVSVVPTHESPSLSQWLQQNGDRLTDANIKVNPPASLCSIQLEGRDSGCAAYRLQL